jgi:hypothetical protein
MSCNFPPESTVSEWKKVSIHVVKVESII